MRKNQRKNCCEDLSPFEKDLPHLLIKIDSKRGAVLAIVVCFSSHPLPKPRTYFNVRLIDGMARFFPNSCAATWNQTHVSRVAPDRDLWTMLYRLSHLGCGVLAMFGIWFQETMAEDNLFSKILSFSNEVKLLACFLNRKHSWFQVSLIYWWQFHLITF